MTKLLSSIVRVIITILAIVFALLVLVWRIVTFLFRYIPRKRAKMRLDRFLAENGHKKFLFYTSSNYKVVEQYLLPLLDASFTVHFIEKGDITAWNGSPYLKEILESEDLKGGYPYFIKLIGTDFDFLSFRHDLSRLKNGVIAPVYVQSRIYFFFNTDASQRD